MQALRKAAIYSILYFLSLWLLLVCMGQGQIGTVWHWMFHSDFASVLWPALLFIEIWKKPKADLMVVLATFLFCSAFMIEGVMVNFGNPYYRAHFWQITWYGLLPIIESMPYSVAILLGRKLTGDKQKLNVHQAALERNLSGQFAADQPLAENATL